MRIGVDIDGVLNDIGQWHYSCGFKFCIDNHIKRGFHPNEYMIEKQFELTDIENYKFWREYIFDLMVSIPTRPYAGNILKLLKEMGLVKKQLSGINGVFDIFSNTIEVNILNYSNPIVIIQSIAYFSFFTTLTIKSKVINKFSGLMLGVYFIHENDHLRSQLYTWLDILNIPKNSALILVEVIIMTVIIFVGCSIVEFTRQQLFHLISKNKLFQKIRNNYYNWVKTIHIVNS